MPLLALLSGNPDNASPDAVVWSITLAVGFVLISWFVLASLTLNVRTSALAVTLLMLTALSARTITRLGLALQLSHPLPVTGVLALSVAMLILRFGGRATVLTTFANASLIGAALLVGSPIALREWQRPVTPPPKAIEPSSNDASDTGSQLPDIYVVILDGYGRSDVLRTRFGFENPLEPYLRSQGFFVAEQASSNYPQTALSLASSLNLEYLPSLVREIPPEHLSRRTLADLIADNRFLATLRNAGYVIRFYASEYRLVRSRLADERPRPFLYLTDFEYGAYETTVLPRVFEAFGVHRGWAPLAIHRHHVRWTLEQLAREPMRTDKRPRLVFAHLLIPHPPFAFDANGGARPTRLPATFHDGDAWHGAARGSGEDYRLGYVDAVTYLNSRLRTFVQSVLTNSRRPPIVYIQSDHGPGLRLTLEDPAATDLRERLGILLAARFPSGLNWPLHARSTPVNGFRVLLNRAVGTQLAVVDDRSYFTTWSRPFDFIDVTDSVR